MGRQVLRRWIVNDFSGNLTGVGTYDVAGDAVFTLDVAPTGLYVEIERVVIDVTSGTAFGLYAIDAGTNVFLRDYAGPALLATDPIQVDDVNTPIRFNPQENIVAAFTGGTPGDQATIYCQAWTVYYEMVELADYLGEGTVVTRGQHRGQPSAQPDPGGWN